MQVREVSRLHARSYAYVVVVPNCQRRSFRLATFPFASNVRVRVATMLLPSAVILSAPPILVKLNFCTVPKASVAELVKALPGEASGKVYLFSLSACSVDIARPLLS